MSPQRACLEEKDGIEGLQVTAKGCKNLAGGKRLHLLVVISHNKGVLLVQEYEKMTGAYFARFVRDKFAVLFSRKRGRKRFVMDIAAKSSCSESYKKRVL